MISPRILNRSQWEPRLHAAGCKRYDDKTGFRLEMGEYWETSNGRLFIVPMDNGEGRLRADDFQEVMAKIMRLKPLDLND